MEGPKILGKIDLSKIDNNSRPLNPNNKEKRKGWRDLNQVIKGKIFASSCRKCIYCGLKFHGLEDSRITLEHLIPLSRGGSNKFVNLRLSCLKCNNDKGRLTDFEYRQKLSLIEAEKIIKK